MEGKTLQEKESGGWKSILIGVLLSAGILLFLALNIEWRIFLSQFSKIRWEYLPLIVVLFYVSFVIRALRWRYLLPSHAELSTHKLYDAALVGFFATCVLPLRAGEFVRPWVLSKWESVSFPAGFASIVTERVFDVLMILALLGYALSELEGTHELVSVGAKALGILALCILAVMLLAYFRAKTLLAILRGLAARFLGDERKELQEKLLGAAEEFIAGLRAISSAEELALVLFWSLVLWLETALLYQVGMWVFGEFPPFPVGIAIMVLIAFAVAAPSAPGFLGTFQIGCAAALCGIFSYSEEFALAFSVVLHGVQLLLAVLTGAWILKRSGLSLQDIRRRS